MSNDKEVELNETQKEIQRGDRGQVGTPTNSLTIKQRWHEATHILKEVGHTNNPHKQAWVRKAGTPSLKKFARQLLASGDQLAKDWFACKNGALNESRSEKNRARVAVEATASKQARRKKGASNKTKTVETV